MEKLSAIRGNWRAKMMQAVVYFKKGDKETGNYFLITALKESGYNSEVMYITSSIYILNELSINTLPKLRKLPLSAVEKAKHSLYHPFSLR